MSESISDNDQNKYGYLAVAAALVFLYATVLAKLTRDWWTDENYSHGLLVPFVIAFIVWREWDRIKAAAGRSWKVTGGICVLGALACLAAGMLGAELFMQRTSMVLMLAGLVLFLFGPRVLGLLAVPFALLVLAIPIPQIIFNRIAFPLQIWASQMAVWGIRLFDVPTLRKGNVIDILPGGATQTISLEVVEACSGIRSLMTLVTLGLILSYFTRGGGRRWLADLTARDLLRTVVLMVAAVPIAVLTNAGRVTATGILTYHYGKQATESTWHDASGWLVYLIALALLLGADLVLKRVLGGRRAESVILDPPTYHRVTRAAPVVPLIAVLVAGGLSLNWFVSRGEAEISRRALVGLPASLGDWRQKGGDIKFDPQIETVLKTSDYTMREYMLPNGRMGNLYVGYYASQRTGATYHSPQNCLPGAGWVMRDPQPIDITMSDGRTFQANRYFVENGVYKEVMIYWYQGRGRTEASEYRDKINTVLDSVTRRRSDGAIVRVMTSVGSDETAAVAAATDLSAKLAETLTEFVPE